MPLRFVGWCGIIQLHHFLIVLAATLVLRLIKDNGGALMGNGSDGFDSQPYDKKPETDVTEAKHILRDALIHYGAGMLTLPLGSR